MTCYPPKTSSGEGVCIYLRVQPKGYRAWIVIINRGSGKKIDKTFSFIKYGGENAAFQAARRFRDEMLLKHPPQKHRESRQVVRSSNSSGYAGVYRRTSGKQSYWVAQTQMHNGKHVRKFFNVGLLGDEQALTLAIEERQQQLTQIVNRQYRNACREHLYLELSSGQEAVQINGEV